MRTMKLAKRLEAAILAGKAVTAEGVGVDIHGQTYVIEKHHTLNRMLSAGPEEAGILMRYYTSLKKRITIS